MKKAIQFGAGNIGRGFIGQLLSQSGYEVVFVEVDEALVRQLNADRTYPVRIISSELTREIVVSNVRAVSGRDIAAVAREIADAEIMATAVGVNALPFLVPALVQGLRQRWAERNWTPINILICENLISAPDLLGGLIQRELTASEQDSMRHCLGLVQASVGRMVPIMTREMQEGNPLRIWVEEFCELPVDAAGFKGSIPEVTNLHPFSPFEYYIERKLFIHNLGHAIAAYLGFLKGCIYIWEAVEDPHIRHICAGAMQESALALASKFEISRYALQEHIDDLLRRFANRRLADTVKRVGKDPIRKLSPEDRLIGSLRLCTGNQSIAPFICAGIAAALCFDVPEDGASQRLIKALAEQGPEGVLASTCGLTAGTSERELICQCYNRFSQGATCESVLQQDWFTMALAGSKV